MIRPILAALLGWLVPGLGHLIVGRPAKGVYFAVLVLGLFAIGMWLGEGASVSAIRYPFHVYGQFGAALPAWIAETVWGVVPTDRTIDMLELGVVFTTVAGIMNVIVVVDAYETARRDEMAS